MRLSIFLFLILFSGFATESMAQSSFSLEPQIGYGTFRMKLLEEYQQKIIHDIGVNARATDQFPAYLVYGLKLSYSENGMRRSGLLLERGSTGGRVTYADYSGSFTADQLLNYTAIGLFVEDRTDFDEFPVQLVLGGEAQFLINNMILDNHLEVFHQKFAEQEAFRSFGMGVKPYAGFAYLYKKVEGILSLGYVVNENGQFHVKGDKDLLLDEKIKADWRGFRLSTSIHFKF